MTIQIQGYEAWNLRHLYSQGPGSIVAHPKLPIYGTTDKEYRELVELYENLKTRGDLGKMVYERLEHYMQQGRLALYGVPGQRTTAPNHVAELAHLEDLYVRGQKVDRVIAISNGWSTTAQRIHFHEEAAHFFIETLKPNLNSACPLEDLPSDLVIKAKQAFKEAGEQFSANPHNRYIWKKIFFDYKRYPEDRHAAEWTAKALALELSCPGILDQKVPALKKLLNEIVFEARGLAAKIGANPSIQWLNGSPLLTSIRQKVPAGLMLDIVCSYDKRNEQAIQQAVFDGTAIYAIGYTLGAFTRALFGGPLTLTLALATTAAELAPDLGELIEEHPSVDEVIEGYGVLNEMKREELHSMQENAQLLALLQKGLKQLNPATIWQNLKEHFHPTPPEDDTIYITLETAVEQKGPDFWKKALVCGEFVVLGALENMARQANNRAMLHHFQQARRQADERMADLSKLGNLTYLSFCHNFEDSSYFASPETYFKHLQERLDRYKSHLAANRENQQTLKLQMQGLQRTQKSVNAYFEDAIREQQEMAEAYGGFFTFVKVLGQCLSIGKEKKVDPVSLSAEIGAKTTEYFTNRSLQRLQRKYQALSSSLSRAAASTGQNLLDLKRQENELMQEGVSLRATHRNEANPAQLEADLKELEGEIQRINEQIAQRKAPEAPLGKRPKKRGKKQLAYDVKVREQQAAATDNKIAIQNLNTQKVRFEREARNTQEALNRARCIAPFRLEPSPPPNESPFVKAQREVFENVFEQMNRNVHAFRQRHAPVDQAVSQVVSQADDFSLVLEQALSGTRLEEISKKLRPFVHLSSHLWQGFRLYQEATEVRLKQWKVLKDIRFKLSDGTTEKVISWKDIFQTSFSGPGLAALTTLATSEANMYMKGVCLAFYAYNCLKALCSKKELPLKEPDKLQDILDSLEHHFGELKHTLDDSIYVSYKQGIDDFKVKIECENKLADFASQLTAERFTGYDLDSDKSQIRSKISHLPLLLRNPDYFSGLLINSFRTDWNFAVPNAVLLEATARRFLSLKTPQPELAKTLIQQIEAVEAFYEVLPPMLNHLIADRNAVCQERAPRVDTKALKEAYQRFLPYCNRALNEDFVGSKRFYLNDLAKAQLLAPIQEMGVTTAYYQANHFVRCLCADERALDAAALKAELAFYQLPVNNPPQDYIDRGPLRSYSIDLKNRKWIHSNTPSKNDFCSVNIYLQKLTYFINTAEVVVELNEKAITALDLQRLYHPYHVSNYDEKLKSLIRAYFEFLENRVEGKSLELNCFQGLNAELIPSSNPAGVPLLFPTPMLQEIKEIICPEYALFEAEKAHFIPSYHFEPHLGKLYLDFAVKIEDSPLLKYISIEIAQVDRKTLQCYQKYLSEEASKQTWTEFLLIWFYGHFYDFGLPGASSYTTAGQLFAPKEEPFEGLFNLWTANPSAYLVYDHASKEKKWTQPLPQPILGADFKKAWLSLKGQTQETPAEKRLKQNFTLAFAMMKHLSHDEEYLLKLTRTYLRIQAHPSDHSIGVWPTSLNPHNPTPEDIQKLVEAVRSQPNELMQKLAFYKKSLNKLIYP